MAEGGVGGVATASRHMAGSPQMFTDWDGLMDDLFHNRGKRLEFILMLSELQLKNANQLTSILASI